MFNPKKSSILLLAILSAALSVFSAPQKEVVVNRSQAWVLGQLKINLNANWGMLLREGSRYNLTYAKEVDGVIMDDKTEGFWLQELWAGAYYKRPISKKLVFSANLLYRPQYWYPDESKSASFLRHTFSSALSGNYAHGKVTLNYRLMVWGLFAAEQTETVKSDNEAIIRNLFGATWSFSKNWKTQLSYELYLKPTADDDDVDGTEVVYRHAIWAGVQYVPVTSLTLSLQYVPFITNKQNSDNLGVLVYDHQLSFEVIKTINLSKKNNTIPGSR